MGSTQPPAIKAEFVLSADLVDQLAHRVADIVLAKGESDPARTDDLLSAVADVRPSIRASVAREFEEDIERFARFENSVTVVTGTVTGSECGRSSCAIGPRGR